MPHVVSILCLLFLVAAAGIAIGVRLAAVPEFSKRVVPFSGGVLAGIAGFWVLPEIAGQEGWISALLGLTAGFALLWIIDRFLYPVCPACSHGHDHGACTRQLHGFAAPLLAAAAMHAFFDGWSLAISQEQPSDELKLVFLAGVSIHKLPEGLALGGLLLAATGSSWKAGWSALAAQTGMFLGAFAAVLLATRLTPAGTSVLLAMAAGVFLYLSYHAVEGSLRQRGWVSAFMTASTGAVGAAILRLVPGL